MFPACAISTCMKYIGQKDRIDPSHLDIISPPEADRSGFLSASAYTVLLSTQAGACFAVALCTFMERAYGLCMQK